ncbi:MAG: DUF177 domain-containing protein [Candidatus Bipolaricaulia bacterium]
MLLDVLAYLDQPGRRFPVHAILDGSDAEEGGVRTVEDVVLEGEAFVQLSTLYLDVEIEARIVQPCGRCLTTVESRFHLHESFTLPIPPQATSVDVRPHVVRLALSAHDPNVICRPDCRGLCPVCGQDLNLDPLHGHAPGGPDRRRLGDFLGP